MVCVDLLRNKANNILLLIGTQAYTKEEFILVLLQFHLYYPILRP